MFILKPQNVDDVNREKKQIKFGICLEWKQKKKKQQQHKHLKNTKNKSVT